MIVWLVPEPLFLFCFVERYRSFILFREASYDKISLGCFLKGNSMLNALFAKGPESIMNKKSRIGTFNF